MSNERTICSHISVGGPTQAIVADGREFFFEMHPYFGPVVVHRATLAEVEQPPGKSPFWDAVTLWDRQGRRMGEDGRCLWEPLPPIYIRRVSARRWENCMAGEPGAIACQQPVWPRM